MDAMPDGVEVREVSPREGWELFDAAARRFLGMSGAEFLEAWDRGAFAEEDSPDVTLVALLIPFARS